MASVSTTNALYTPTVTPVDTSKPIEVLPTVIGLVELNVPISNIQVYQGNEIIQVETMRSLTNILVAGGPTNIRVSMRLIFPDYDSINDQFRTLLAQFKRTPILPVQNDIIFSLRETGTITQEDVKSSYNDTLAVKKKQEEKLSRIKKNIEWVQNLSEEIVQSLQAAKPDNVERSRIIRQNYNRAYELLKDEGFDDNDEIMRYVYVTFNLLEDVYAYGNIGNMSPYVDVQSRGIQANYSSGGLGTDFAIYKERIINEYKSLSQEIEHYQQMLNKLPTSNIAITDPLAMALMSMSVSTTEMSAESLIVDLLLTEFNHRPFQSRVVFNGPQNNPEDKLLQDTQFSKWVESLKNRNPPFRGPFGNEFAGITPLGTRDNVERVNVYFQKFGLARYGDYQSMLFGSVHMLSPEDLKDDKNPKNKRNILWRKPISNGNQDCVIQKCTAMLQNRMPSIPIPGAGTPTLQSVGSATTTIGLQLLFRKESEQFKDFNNLLLWTKQQVDYQWWKQKSVWAIYNDFCNMMGVYFAIPSNISFNTREDTADWIECNLELIEFHPAQYEAEKLHDDNSTRSEQIEKVANYLINNRDMVEKWNNDSNPIKRVIGQRFCNLNQQFLQSIGKTNNIYDMADTQKHFDDLIKYLDTQGDNTHINILDIKSQQSTLDNLLSSGEVLLNIYEFLEANPLHDLQPQKPELFTKKTVNQIRNELTSNNSLLNSIALRQKYTVGEDALKTTFVYIPSTIQEIPKKQVLDNIYLDYANWKQQVRYLATDLVQHNLDFLPKEFKLEAHQETSRLKYNPCYPDLELQSLYDVVKTGANSTNEASAIEVTNPAFYFYDMGFEQLTELNKRLTYLENAFSNKINNLDDDVMRMSKDYRYLGDTYHNIYQTILLSRQQGKFEEFRKQFRDALLRDEKVDSTDYDKMIDSIIEQITPSEITLHKQSVGRKILNETVKKFQLPFPLIGSTIDIHDDWIDSRGNRIPNLVITPEVLVNNVRKFVTLTKVMNQFGYRTLGGLDPLLKPASGVKSLWIDSFKLAGIRAGYEEMKAFIKQSETGKIEMKPLYEYDINVKPRMQETIANVRRSLNEIDYGMKRAFPTYKVYFIDEDSEELMLLDDLYSYNAVKNVEIVRSKNNPIDIAIITLSNLYGTLTAARKIDENGNPIDPSLDYDMFRGTGYEWNIFERKDITTQFGASIANQLFGGQVPIATDATSLKARIGASKLANDNYQSITGNQKLSQMKLQAGTRIQIKLGFDDNPKNLENVFTGVVAELQYGDEVTLVCQSYGFEALTPASDLSFSQETPYKVLLKLNKDLNLAKTARHIIFNPIFEQLQNPDPTKRGLLSNIYIPENDIVNDMTFNTNLSGFTLYDTLDEITKVYPGMICSIVPFDLRATIYLGHPDGLYWYTNQGFSSRKIDAIRFLKDASLYNITNHNSLSSQYMGDITESMGNFLARNLTEFQQWSDRLDLSPGSMATTWIETPYFKHTLRKANALLGQNYFQIGKVFQMSLSETQAAYARQIHRGLVTDPLMKPFRNYFIVDSLHDIVSNNITSANNGVYTRVHVWSLPNLQKWSVPRWFALESLTDKNERAINRSIPVGWQPRADDLSVTATANILLHENEMRTDIDNALTTNEETLISYARSLLWRNIKSMYRNTITILGNPRIKPYDIVVINDDYNKMHGPIEVEQVVHRFSFDTGFITEITPNLFANFNARSYDVEATSLIVTPMITGRANREASAGSGFWGPVSQSGLEMAIMNPIAFIPLVQDSIPMIGDLDPRVGQSWQWVTPETLPALLRAKDSIDAAKEIGRARAQLDYMP